MKKKEAPSWYIATTHYLTAGFVPGILCGAVGALLVHFFTSDSPFLSQTIFALLVPVAAYLGVKYSAIYLRRAYVLTAAESVATIASVYYAIIQVCGVLAVIYLAVRSEFPEGLVLVMMIAVTQALAGFLVFYSMSKICIENDPVRTSFSDPRVPTGLFPEHYTPPHTSSLETPEAGSIAPSAAPAAPPIPPTPPVAAPPAPVSQ